MDTTFAAHYDAATSTLQLSGDFDPRAWDAVGVEVDRAYRRAALRLTVDLTRTRGVPPHALGELVHLLNCCYPGTLLRPAERVRRAEPQRQTATAA